MKLLDILIPTLLSFLCIVAHSPTYALIQGTNSCTGSWACYETESVGDNSCTGTNACERAGTIGNGSCNGYQACKLAQSEIGNDSCNGDQACIMAQSEIGNDSCNRDQACENCQGVVPNGKCNAGSPEDHFTDSASHCKWCNPVEYQEFIAVQAALDAQSGGSSTGSGAGDPHFKTFFDIAYSWHGGCDAVFLRSIMLGIEIHIRTTRIQRKTGSYSVISAVGARIGSDVFEVNDDALVTLNGDVVFDDATTSASSPTLTLPSGLSLSKAMQGTKHRIVVYDVDVGDGERSFQIRVNSKSKVINLDSTGSFPDGQGLLGSTSSKALLGRDGVTDLSTEFNALGTDWQVRQSEEKLFKDKDRYPQHPVGCVYDGTMMNADHAGSHLRGHGRRLSDEEKKLTVEDANAACAHAGNPQKKEFCIADVLALNDLDLAEDPFYAN